MEVQEAYEGPLLPPQQQNTHYQPPLSAPIDGVRKSACIIDNANIDKAQMIKILDQAEACKEAMKKKKRKISKKPKQQSLAENPF